MKRELKVLRNENHYLREQLEFPAKPKGDLQKNNDEKFMKMVKDMQSKGNGLTLLITYSEYVDNFENYHVEVRNDKH